VGLSLFDGVTIKKVQTLSLFFADKSPRKAEAENVKRYRWNSQGWQMTDAKSTYTM
jgi:hypothetical protein